MDWQGRIAEEWLGRTVVSQYGLVCEVVAAEMVSDSVSLTCRARYKGKIWNWPSGMVSLVTRSHELLDSNGEVFGKLSGDKYELYDDARCRTISPAEIDAEFATRQ